MRKPHLLRIAVMLSFIGLIIGPGLAAGATSNVPTSQVLLDLEQDGQTVQEFFATRPGLQDAFAGIYIDPAAEGQLVLQLVRTHSSTPAILAQLPRLRHRDRVRTEHVAWSLKHLEQQKETITNAAIAREDSAVQAVGVDQTRNHVVVVLDPASTATTTPEAVAKSSLPADLATIVADPAVVVRTGKVTGGTTAAMAGQGWNPTGCTLGFEVVAGSSPSMLTAGHCVKSLGFNTIIYQGSTRIGYYTNSYQYGATTDTGTGIDVGVLRMDSAATATDDIFRPNQASIDVSGAVATTSYVKGNTRSFTGVGSNAVKSSAITNGSFNFQWESRWFRDMFATEAYPIGGDSGGPVYAISGSSALAAGTVMGYFSIPGITATGYDGVHSKWHIAANHFGLALVTTD